MPEDEKAAESSPAGEESKTDESLKAAEQGAETPKGEESEKTIPYERFKEVNDAKKAAESELQQARNLLAGYQQEFGVIRTEEDLADWRKYRASILKGAREAEEEGEISPKRLAEIRKVMRKADPEYVEMLSMKQRIQQQEAARLDSQYDDAEEIVRELAANEYGYKSEIDDDGNWKSKHESEISDIGSDVILAIRKDNRLTRLWNTGNTDRAVRKAFEMVKAKHEKLGKTITQMRQEAAQRKKVLPTLRGGRGTVSSKPPDKRKEKGFTPDTGDAAWARYQEALQE